MTLLQGRYLLFGPFRLDRLERALLKDGAPVKLSSSELPVLLALLERPGEAVEKKQLIKAGWGKEFVEEENLRQTVRRLRQKLGNKASGEPYIATVHGQGYSFTDAVSVEASEVQVAAPVRRRSWVVALACTTLGVAGILAGFGNLQRPLKVASVQALTSSGTLASLPLVTDGRWVYGSLEREGLPAIPIRVPMDGGELARVNLPPGYWRFLDIDERGTFLLGRTEPTGGKSLWTWRPDRTAAPFGRVRVANAIWVGNGRVAAVVVREGSEPAKGDLVFLSAKGIESRIGLPETAEAPRFSQRRAAIRFVAKNSRQDAPSLWEVGLFKGKPQPMAGLPKAVDSDAWSRDGGLFAFSAWREGVPDHYDLWAIDERPLHRRTPVKLTSGLLDFTDPVFSPDGSRIFATGRKEHKELVKYEAQRHRFEPFLGGMDAIEPEFSPDGEWVAYTTSAERVLYVMNANDGSAKKRLTPPGVQAVEPHWSPDGTRIAFAGIVDGKWRIHVVPAAGGAPVVAQGPEDQGIPTWSKDGSKIVFGELQDRKPRAEMSIHLLDVASGAVTEMAGSKGLWSPRWSPDGKWILATTPDSRELRLLDVRKRRWRMLLRAHWIDFAGWSRDSRYIHFYGIGVSGYDAPDGPRSMYRYWLGTGRVETVVRMDLFRPALPVWYGEARDGSPLALERISTDDIYALKLEK